MPSSAPDETTPTLLRTAYNLFSAGVFGGLVQAGFSELRPTHGNVMEPLAIEDGLRLTELAARAGMAPQSMGELVDNLVARGYVERRDDPSDRRAKRIHLTAKGRANAEASRVAVDTVERRLADLLGDRQYRQLRRTLMHVVERGELLTGSGTP